MQRWDDLDAQVASLRELLTEPAAQRDNRPRIYVAGTPELRPRLAARIDELGARQVGEDVTMDRDVLGSDPDPWTALASTLSRSGPGALSSLSPDERARRTAQRALTARADGALLVCSRGDLLSEWDFPLQRAALDAIGVPCLTLTSQPSSGALTEEADSELAEFAALLSAGSQVTR